MDRTLPGVHFIDTFEEERNRISENGIATNVSAAPSVITSPMAASTLQSSAATISNPIISMPTSNPIISITTSNPVISMPSSNPIMSMPTSNPVISMTSSNPIISMPTTNPVISMQPTNPVISMQPTNPNISMPTSNPNIPMPTSTPIISVVAHHTEVTEPQQVLRQPLSSIVSDGPVNRRPKTEDFTSTESSMSAPATSSGQSLIDFLDKLDNYKPTIPESIVQYYMQTAGLSNSDPRVTQLIALAGQKFISDVVNDAYHFSQTQKCKKSSDKKPTLTLDVLKPVLAEYGINVQKPAYMQ